VTKHLKDISLRSALKVMLDELQFTYVIRNGVLLITTPTKAKTDEFLETRVYPVADLVLQDHRGGALDLQPLKDVLNTTIVAKTYDGPGGCIAGIVVGNRPLLVVWQSVDIHEQIERTLEVLRKAGGLKGPDAASPKENVIHLKKHEEER
jgi:hypothetical protein